MLLWNKNLNHYTKTSFFDFTYVKKLHLQKTKNQAQIHQFEFHSSKNF